MNNIHRKNKPSKRSRVIEQQLPTDRLYRPRGGDWSQWEAAARRQMNRAHKELAR